MKKVLVPLCVWMLSGANTFLSSHCIWGTHPSVAELSRLDRPCFNCCAATNSLYSSSCFASSFDEGRTRACQAYFIPASRSFNQSLRNGWSINSRAVFRSSGNHTSICLIKARKASLSLVSNVGSVSSSFRVGTRSSWRNLPSN